MLTKISSIMPFVIWCVVSSCRQYSWSVMFWRNHVGFVLRFFCLITITKYKSNTAKKLCPITFSFCSSGLKIFFIGIPQFNSLSFVYALFCLCVALQYTTSLQPSQGRVSSCEQRDCKKGDFCVFFHPTHLYSSNDFCIQLHIACVLVVAVEWISKFMFCKRNTSP